MVVIVFMDHLWFSMFSWTIHGCHCFHGPFMVVIVFIDHLWFLNVFMDRS